MFLIAFACSVVAVNAPGEFRCGDRTEVHLASSVRAAAFNRDVMNDVLIGQKLRCQGFASDAPGHLTATCRLPSGEDVAHNILRQTAVGEDRRQDG